MSRPKPQDLPGVEGPGVSVPKHKDLDRLGDKFIEIRDAKAKLAGDLTKQEQKIAELMLEKGISKYQFADQEIIVKQGKVHIKIKTVKADGVESAEESE